MNVVANALPELLGSLGAALVIGIITWYVRRQRTRVRRYTLLGTVGADGNPVQHVTTRGAGTMIFRDVCGQRERFELTNIQVADGTYAAEPIDRYR